MKMKFPIIEYKQNNFKLITTVLPFQTINNFSKVLVYGIDDGGYQREPDERHYSKIKTYINKEQFIFPTSIILGIDDDQVIKLIKKEGNQEYIDFSKIESEKIFRIVDGQHRLKGIEAALKDNPNLNNLDLSVTIICTPQNSRSLEMEIFGTINSKSKRIKVDLIELARYDYRVLENKIGTQEINEHISIEVAHLLNENRNPDNKWFNAIKFGIHDEEKVGIIGVNAFRESLKPIVSLYLSSNNNYHDLNGNDIIKFAKHSANEIEYYIQNAWSIVYDKWPKCFSDKSEELDFDMEIRKYYYRSNYYIQKTMGAKAINYLLGNIVSTSSKKLDSTSIDIFRSKIKSCEVLTSDWEVGKTFSGYSSESGFSKVSKMISGELKVPRN